jgi:hypothetical protein
MDIGSISESNCGSHISNSISGISCILRFAKKYDDININDIISKNLESTVLDLLFATKTSILEVGKSITTKDQIILTFVKALDSMAQNDSTYFSDELLTLIKEVKEEYICEFKPLVVDKA